MPHHLLRATDLSARCVRPLNRAAQRAGECGAIESLLAHYVRQHDVDLVVTGSQGRSGLMGLILGSTAARLLDWLPCDTLLMRDPRG